MNIHVVACGRDTCEGVGSIYSVVHKDSIVKDTVVCVLAKKTNFATRIQVAFPNTKRGRYPRGVLWIKNIKSKFAMY